MLPKKGILIFMMFLASWGFSQSPLEQYINEALENNLALKQKELDYSKSLAALKEAKSMFFPTLSLNARYSMARGGRTINFPVGDLMNPVYSNLNMLNSLASNGSPDFPTIPDYPTIQNEEINFLRETEQETTIRMALPVYNPSIIQNQRIKEHLAEVEMVSMEIYQQELIKEVKTAYFNYLKAVEAAKLFENTIALVQEGLRTSQSLYKNQKVTIDEVYAAEAQVKEIELQLAEAEKNVQVAEAYFNFLLNRDYNTPIEKIEAEELPKNILSLESARNTGINQRKELLQLSHAIAASDEKIKLDRGAYKPNLTLITDYGIQGTNYSFGRDDDFVMGSLVLSWDLFNPSTKHKVQQSQIERERVNTQRQEVSQQIGLQIVSAYYDLETALKSINLAESQVASAQKAFRLMDKKYQQGQANLVQHTDARTRLTNAQQQLIIAKYDYHLKNAALERVIGK